MGSLTLGLAGYFSLMMFSTLYTRCGRHIPLSQINSRVGETKTSATNESIIITDQSAIGESTIGGTNIPSNGGAQQ